MSSYYGDRSREIPTWDSFEAGEDDEAVDISEYQYAARDHLLFCIDASASMHKARPSKEDPEEEGRVIKGKSALHEVLESVVKFQKGKVITGPADSVGLMLFNVNADKVKNTSGNYKPGTFVYQNLRTINAEEIKKIIKLVEEAEGEYEEMDENREAEEPSILHETFPPAKKGDELNIADVLLTCNFLFRDAGTKLAGNKRVFLVTDNDAPGSLTNLAPAQTIYGDLLTYGITVNTFFIDRPDHRFDPRRFWNDVLSREDEDGAPTAASDDGLRALAEIMDDLIIRQAPKRRHFSIPMKLGGKDGDIEIGVSGYSIVSEQGKGQPKLVRMRGQAVEEVLSKTIYTTVEDTTVLRPEEITHAFKFGNEATIPNILEPNWWQAEEHEAQQKQVADEAERLGAEWHRQRDEGGEADVEAMKQAAGPGVRQGQSGSGTTEAKKVVARTRLQFKPEEVKELKTLGVPTRFQSGDNLKYDENVKHSYFIYPDEDAYTGSTRTFAALHKALLKLNKHALALTRFRTNTTPEISVLIPQQETFAKDGSQDQPPGFHVVPIPFADDIRKPPKSITDNLLATERQTELMATIVKRLKIKKEIYRSEAYPNPALAFHYAQLQSLAFEEDFDPAEATDLDKTLPNHAGMHKAAGEYMKEWNVEIEGDDRAVMAFAKPGKRPAAAEVSEADLADIEGQWQKGKLDKLKVAELKDYIKFKKINLDGKSKKADLVLLLDAWLKTNVGMGSKKVKKA